MTQEQYIAFDAFRNEFKAKITEWNSLAPELLKLQKEAAMDAKTPSYSFETPVVYNRALDEITENDEIKIIVIGDNPGKDEQLLKNNKYLVGQAGKLGEGFFKKNPELGIDFRKNAIILNKTPVHTAKTNQIKYLLKNGSQEIKNLLEETQVWMAQKTAELSEKINAEIWLVGYSELKPKGLFSRYRETLKTYANLKNLFVFQHFSMNRFTIDLANFQTQHKELSLKEAIETLGKEHLREIFGDN